MLIAVKDFRGRASARIDDLVADLQATTGRYGDEEAAAWRASLPTLAQSLADPKLDELHLYLNDGTLSLEYQLPSSSSWADAVLLGCREGQSTALMIELKHWQTEGDSPGAIEGLMTHRGHQTLHPSDQVRGYTEYCRRFHSAVHRHEAKVAGCVMFTGAHSCEIYAAPPNLELTTEYPCFAVAADDGSRLFQKFVVSRLAEPDPVFASAFEQGYYHQDRDFIRLVGQQIADAEGPFELLDGQRKAFSLVRSVVGDVASEASSNRKRVVIVKGPPGSGKSVVAVKTWASLAQDPDLRAGNIVFTTTSACQTKNWQQLFADAARSPGARGIVLKANDYMPITTHELGQIRKRLGKSWLGDISRWRDNLGEIMFHRQGGFRIPDSHFFVSIVDEAHALINPEHTDSRGQFGFVVAAGPQAFHIMRASDISVFFLDPQQSFRERETTTVDDLKTWAGELGADVIELSLEGHQFRCAGSVEYVDWVGRLLSNAPPATVRETGFLPVRVPRHAAEDVGLESPGLEMKVLDSPFELEEALRQRTAEGYTVRQVASYARPWSTKGIEDPHGLPLDQKDFCESSSEWAPNTVWAKVWNFVPGGTDYTAFIQARPGTPMSEDPLCEVGCPYVVRGFDFDYVGLLWFSDLVWETGRWDVRLEEIHESGLINHVRRAKKEKYQEGPEHLALLKKVMQGYRILLTRAKKGVYFWFEDQETRQRVESCLDNGRWPSNAKET